MTEREDWMDDPDLAPTEEELAEAEALAHALARGTVKRELEDAFPEDAFATAGLVAFSHDGGALSEEKLGAIFETVLAEAKPKPVEAPAPWWKRWMIPIGFASAASVAVVLFAVLRGPSLSSAPVALPAPDDALLRAQAAAVAGDGRDALDSQMGSYRGAVLAALEDRYTR